MISESVPPYQQQAFGHMAPAPAPAPTPAAGPRADQALYSFLVARSGASPLRLPSCIPSHCHRLCVADIVCLLDCWAGAATTSSRMSENAKCTQRLLRSSSRCLSPVMLIILLWFRLSCVSWARVWLDSCGWGAHGHDDDDNDDDDDDNDDVRTHSRRS
jgi:hypothetical protein